MVVLSNYENKYKQVLDELQKEVWGEGSDTDDIISTLNDRYVRLAFIDNEVVGASVSEVALSSCHIDFIIIKPGFQKMGIGSLLMKDIVEYCSNSNIKLIECEAIDVFGKVNAEKLLNKYEFVCTYSKDNYWGELYPDFYCKQCNSKPCVCTMKKYVKEL